MKYWIAYLWWLEYRVQIMHSLLFILIYKNFWIPVAVQISKYSNFIAISTLKMEKIFFFICQRLSEFFKCCDGLHVNKCPCAIVIAAERKIPSLHVAQHRHCGYLSPFCLLSCWKALYEVPLPGIEPFAPAQVLHPPSTHAPTCSSHPWLYGAFGSLWSLWS